MSLFEITSGIEEFTLKLHYNNGLYMTTTLTTYDIHVYKKQMLIGESKIPESQSV